VRELSAAARASYGAVWVTNPDASVVQNMTVGGGWVWPRGTSTLTRIDPRTNTVVERYGPSWGSGADIVGDCAVWVSARDVETVWRLPIPHRVRLRR
jgi:hypothetical protein